MRSVLSFLCALIWLQPILSLEAVESNKKIAFLFMARGLTPLEDIWREFFRWKADEKHYKVVIHVHKGYKIPETSFFHGKELPDESREGGGYLWGNMGQVRAIKRLVAYALKDPDVQWFTMMSESCIPLSNFNTMRNSLLGFDKSIVNSCDMGAGEMETHTRWRPSLDEGGFDKKWWRKSGTWFALMRDHATMFVEETKFEPYWEKVPCCDEHYLPSILAYYGQDNRTTCSDGFCHVHWPNLMAMHPHTYSGDEITPELFQHLANPEGDHGFGKKCSGVDNMCHFTARKFGAASKYQLLENIDLILSDDDDQYDGNPWDHHQDKFRVDDEGTYYLLENGMMRKIPDAETLKALHHIQDADKPTQKLTALDKEAFPMGDPVHTRKDGQLIKAAKSNWVFVTEGGKRRGIPNMETLLHLKFTLADVQVLPDADIEQIVMGEPMPDVKSKHGNGNNKEGHKGGHGKEGAKKKRTHELGEHDHLGGHNNSKNKEGESEEEEHGGDGTAAATTAKNNSSSSAAGAEAGAKEPTVSGVSSASSTNQFLFQSEATDPAGGKEEGEERAHDEIDKAFWEIKGYYKQQPQP